MSLAIVMVKIVPGVPGSFTRTECIALGSWTALGFALWRAAHSRATSASRS